MLVRVGSRGSRLALIQAERAVAALRAPGIELAVLPITTSGDRDRTRPFGEIGSRGVFVKELEEALLERRIDVAVHSAKDLTATDSAGLSIGAFLRRDDPRDALCGADGVRPGMRIGTASARRKAELLALEPTLSIEPLRGQCRHAAAQARRAGARRDRARGVRVGPARPRGGDRPPLRARGAAARGGPGRARAAGARGGGASRRGGGRCRDARAGRGGADGRCGRRRRVPRAGRGASRRRRRSPGSSRPRTVPGSRSAPAPIRRRSARSSPPSPPRTRRQCRDGIGTKSVRARRSRRRTVL